MKFGLPDRTIKLLKDYFIKQGNVSMVKIYGSRATGKYEKGSDIDFALYTKSKEDISSKIRAELDELPTPYKYDVLDYECINNNALKNEIDKFGVVFYTNSVG